ncbi:MAG: VCBS repeat-containing protein [Acidobacteriota bacterium]|nr:VCBS repeat-containing protein [Acidobacteriota bacterium]
MKNSPTWHRAFVKMSVLAVLSLLISTSSQAQVSLRRALDYDGDGRADAAVFRPTNNTWYIQQSGGGFKFQPFGNSATDVFTPGDYDGDGKGDIAVWRDTDGTFYFLRSSNNTFGAVQWGVTGDEPVARNWDGPATSATEFAVVRRTGNSMFWYIRRADGSFRGEQFGVANDFVAPGDYDGDGVFDLGVQRGTANNGPASFYYQGSTQGFFGVQWGLSNDFVVPGDYDGDNKTDIAVVRDTGGTLNWYIRSSGGGGNQPGTLLSYAWGTSATDLLTQNDYDGDGRTDVAVWRDSNGTFYIRKSSDGQIQGISWGAPADFPIASYDTH